MSLLNQWLDLMEGQTKATIDEFWKDEISLDIDFEKLYFNMHKADADYLWSIPEWDKVLPVERREEIYKEYKKSKTVHVEKKPGRNDPCPCGSGLKYKKCCGKNA